jgi:hypothetical protein
MKQNLKLIGLMAFVIALGIGTQFIKSAAYQLGIDQYQQRTQPEMDDGTTAALWKQLIESYEFTSLNQGGYTFVRSSDAVKMLGVRDARYEKNLDFTAMSPHVKGIIAGQYKIHLMPTDATIDKVFEHLLVLIKNNEQLRAVLNECKIINGYEDTDVEVEESRELVRENGKRYKGNREVLPRIVIYCADGKRNAQHVLNILYEAFKVVEGMNITPRFNTRVTSLMYAAQGGADAKLSMDLELEKYFEQPYKVYFDEYQIRPEDGITHHLVHPETGKVLVPAPEMFAE